LSHARAHPRIACYFITHALYHRLRVCLQFALLSFCRSLHFTGHFTLAFVCICVCIPFFPFRFRSLIPVFLRCSSATALHRVLYSATPRCGKSPHSDVAGMRGGLRVAAEADECKAVCMCLVGLNYTLPLFVRPFSRLQFLPPFSLSSFITPSPLLFSMI